MSIYTKCNSDHDRPDDGLDWLRRRGITDSAIRNFKIVYEARRGAPGCAFPVAAARGLALLRIWKNANSAAKPKYIMPTLPTDLVLYHGDWIAHMRPATLWVVGGFVDVWTLFTLGLYNVACFYTELRIPDNVAEILRGWGVRTVYYVRDRDASGKRAARKLATRLRASDIEFAVRALPDTRTGYDCNALWCDIQFDRSAFLRTLQALPVEYTAHNTGHGAHGDDNGTHIAVVTRDRARSGRRARGDTASSAPYPWDALPVRRRCMLQALQSVSYGRAGSV
jgi:hypothetical protein